MYACDFEYDGHYLSDYGFIICTFGTDSDTDNISPGSMITFNTVSKNAGKKYGLAGTRYEECIQADFEICKNPEFHEDLSITKEEYRNIMRWLNRREFLRFRLLHDEADAHNEFYYEASFNIEKIESDKILYGMHLTLETNSTFGYGMEQVISWTITDTSKKKIINDISDEIGHIYPSMRITINQSGTLSIYNELENCRMEIKNCTKGEIINIDGEAQIISSSLNSHHIYDDFNFEFFRIGNTFENRINKISISLPCKIEFRYSPIVKDSPF